MAALTPEQSALAAAYLPFARKIATRMSRRLVGWTDLDAIHSAAQDGLVDAASRWAPGGPAKFPTFARHRVVGAVLDAIRAENLHRKRFSTKGAAIDVWGHGRAAPAAPDRLDTDEELLAPWLRKLPPGHAAALRRIYIHGETHAEAARVLGLSPSRVTYIHQESVAMLNGTWAGERPGSHRKSTERSQP